MAVGGATGLICLLVGSPEVTNIRGASLESATTMSFWGHRHSKHNIDEWAPNVAVQRCDYIDNLFETKNADKSEEELRDTYAKQSVDMNVFYRATAQIFWDDFAKNKWDDGVLSTLHANLHDAEGHPLDDKSTWTWTPGDQHLSNFGAFLCCSFRFT